MCVCDIEAEDDVGKCTDGHRLALESDWLSSRLVAGWRAYQAVSASP